METEKNKLTDDQLRLAQGVAGIICAAALMVSIFFSQQLSQISGLLGYLFVVVFLVITLGRRWVENKYRLRLNFFNLVLIDGILAGIIVYVVMIFYFPQVPIEISDLGKALIVTGSCLVLFGLGIAFPLWRYHKRKVNGTVRPIRIPEKTEEEKEKEARSVQSNGHSSIERQIAEMTKELEEKEIQDK